MQPKLQTLPSYFQSEQAPTVQSSAFPPFKIEHRYRGVYERAGFDVNLNGLALGKSDASSVTSGKFSKYASPSSKSSSPSENAKYSASLNQYASNSRINLKNKNAVYGEPPKSAPITGARKFSRKAPDSWDKGEHSKSQTDLSSTFTKDVPKFQEPAYTDASPVISKAHVDKKALPPPSEDAFKQQGSTYQHKNLKNLSLNLNQYDSDSSEEQNEMTKTSPGQDWSYETKDTSIDKSINMSQEANLQNENPVTSREKQFDPRQLPSSNKAKLDSKEFSDEEADNDADEAEEVHSLLVAQNPFKNQRLSSALEEFKKDVEDHKNHIPTTPQSSASETFAHAALSKNQGAAPYPLTLPNLPQDDPRLSYNQKFILDTKSGSLPLNSDPSVNFQMFKNAQNNIPELTSSTNPLLSAKNPNLRESLISMVSTILSKESDADDEEDEVEKELERQLQTLKVGDSSSANLSIGRASDTSSLDEFLSPVKDNKSGLVENMNASDIPTFNVQEVDVQDDGDNRDSSAESLLSTNTVFENANENLEDEEPIKPLRVNNSANASKVEVREIGGNVPSNDRQNSSSTLFNKTSPESGVALAGELDIKPLTIKGNKLADQSEEMLDTQKDDVKQPLNDSPEKLLDTDEPSLAKNAPGQGPCRVCHAEIDPTMKGAMKGVYSKTGELSGQWHRSCFRCTYDGCTVLFSKNVQCYALNDYPFCHHHYHELNHSLCNNCSRGIEGECLENELFQKWHLHCLKCHQCDNQIRNDYYLINDMVYCENDAINIIRGASFNDGDGNIRTGGLLSTDKVEKRRTRMMYVD